VGLVLQDVILQYDYVARFGDGKVRLRGDDHAKGLERSRHMDIVLIAGWEHLAKVGGAAVGRDRPKDVRQVAGAEAVGRCQALEAGIDGDAAAFALYLGFPFGLREKRRCPETDFGAAAALKISQGLEMMMHSVELVEVDPVLLCDRGRLLRRADGLGRS